MRTGMISAMAAAIGVASSASGALLLVPTEYPTIQAAITAAGFFDTVLVLPGTYNEAINFQGKRLHIQSITGPTTTIIDGSGLGTSVITMNSGENEFDMLDGFTVRGGSGTFVDGVLRGGGMYLDDAEPTILNCIFRDNGADEGGAIYIGPAIFSMIIYNTLFHDNFAGTGGAIYTKDTTTTLRNCTVAANQAIEASPMIGAGTGGGVYQTGSSELRLTNTIIWGNLPNGVTSNDLESTYSNIQNTAAPGDGNISLDPRFVDSGADDFRLDAASPCIDAGNSPIVATVLTFDVNGEPRAVDDPATPNTGVPVFSIYIDMGAFEWQNTACEPVTCSADVDNNGDVDFNDLLEVLTQWGPCPAP